MRKIANNSGHTWASARNKVATLFLQMLDSYQEVSIDWLIGNTKHDNHGGGQAMLPTHAIMDEVRDRLYCVH